MIILVIVGCAIGYFTIGSVAGGLAIRLGKPKEPEFVGGMLAFFWPLAIAVSPVILVFLLLAGLIELFATITMKIGGVERTKITVD